MFYLRIEDNNFGFVTDEIHVIEPTDIALKKEEYDKFFELQSIGKQFRLKETPTGETLFDYVETFENEIPQETLAPSVDERLNAVEELLMTIMEVM